ncbi:MAG: helix-turn-helix transcriptional regulator [Legionella sp.]|nr:helix-turn-helix transcriptional regulator [Legionella sp.]
MTINRNQNVDALEATQTLWEEMTFGGLIKSLRVCDEITQSDLAKKIGVSKQFLSDVEHDRKDIGISFAKKIADALGYPIESFLELIIKDQLRKQNLHYKVELKKVS